MANISTVYYGGNVISETEEPGDVAVIYDNRTIANLTAGDTKTLNCNGTIIKNHLYIGGKTLLQQMAQMISDVIVAVKSAFPAEPTAYNLIGTYTAIRTLTVPETGWYQIELYGASGNGGKTTYKMSGMNVYYGGGGGGGGGAFCASTNIKLNANDTIVISGDLSVGGTAVVLINSSAESYSNLSCVSGENGKDGSGSTPGAGGAGGTASGGNLHNISGGAGGNGETDKNDAIAVGTGGTAAVSGGNSGARGQRDNTTNPTGLPAFVKIYAGNTNGTGGGGEEITADPVLANNSWEVISKVAKSGKAAEYWSVGDTKTFTCNGYTMTAQIIGFDHDDVTDGMSYGRAKAGITFQFKDIYPETYALGASASPWKNSDMRLKTLPSLLAGLGEIQNYIVSVDKLASDVVGSGGSLETVSDNLFLPSFVEVKGQSGSVYVEGVQYSFYTAGNSCVKKLNGTNNNWWLRTTYKTSSNSFYYIKNTGTAGNAVGSTSYGIAPAFCL